MRERTASVLVGATSVAAAAAQMALATYRRSIDPAPIWIGSMVAAILLIPALTLAVRRVRPIMLAIRTIGWVSVAFGVVAVWGARHAMNGLLVAIGVPLFFFSFAALLVLPFERAKLRTVAVLLFALAISALELYSTSEAQENAQLRKQGITAHWH